MKNDQIIYACYLFLRLSHELIVNLQKSTDCLIVQILHLYCSQFLWRSVWLLRCGAWQLVAATERFKSCSVSANPPPVRLYMSLSPPLWWLCGTSFYEGQRKQNFGKLYRALGTHGVSHSVLVPLMEPTYPSLHQQSTETATSTEKAGTV